MHRQRRPVGIDPWIDDPVFADGRHLQIEIEVAYQVLVGGVFRDDLGHKDRAEVAPAALSQREVQRKIVVSSNVWLWRGRGPSPRHEYTRRGLQMVDEFGMPSYIILQLILQPISYLFVRHVG